MCSAFDWPLIQRSDSPQFYGSQIQVEPVNLAKPVLPELKTPYVLFFHSTAREAKRWSNEAWITLGKELASRGYQVVLPWGSPAEKVISLKLAEQIPNALVPPAFSIEDAFKVIAGAALTVGVDTGLTHLAAVLGLPTVEIYCDSPRWKTEGYWAYHIRNMGDMQSPPDATEVVKASLELLTRPT
jgi:heptosyltransferase-1